MAESRIPREFENRSNAERPKSWMPPELLPNPAPEAGYSFRWIRVSALGNADPMNLSSKLREGWEPVKASEHPEVQVMASGTGRYPDSIEVGGLLLCKTPTEFTQQRDAYYKSLADGQMQSIDSNFMRENDPRMPLFKERSTKVSFGKGS